MKMPEINLDNVSMNAEESEAAQKIVGRGNRLRASKPKTCGKASYVWRMVAFQISPNRQHQCMPMCADFDIDGKYDERKAITDKLDGLVKRIVDTVPSDQLHGVNRWGKALGYFA